MDPRQPQGNQPPVSPVGQPPPPGPQQQPPTGWPGQPPPGWPGQPPPGWQGQPPPPGRPGQPPPGWQGQPPGWGAQVPPPGWPSQQPPGPGPWPPAPGGGARWAGQLPQQGPPQQWGPGPGPAPHPRAPRTPPDPAKREEVAQTLLYTVGSAILIAGLVLLVALIHPLSTSLLVYAFSLGVTVVSLVFVLLGRSSQSAMVVLIIAATLGLGAATASWQGAEVVPVVGLAMATALAEVAAVAGRLSALPSTLVWVAWLAVAVDLVAPDANTSVLVGACCLIATVGRGWPRHQLAVALSMVLAGVQSVFSPVPSWPLVWLVSSVVLALWLVHFHRATPAQPRPQAVPRAPWALPTRGELGGQPWALGLILLPTSWFVSLLVSGIPGWVPLLIATVILIAGLFLPEPPDAVNAQGPLRDAMVIIGVSVLGVTLLLGRVDPVVEPLVLMALAIVAQVVPVVRSSYGWVFRAIPAVLALVAGGDAVVAVWGGASDVVSDPLTILKGVLLTLLGISLMVFRHGRVNDVLDGVRFVGGLYLSVHGVVLAASLIGLRTGHLDGGFLIGHTLASLGWMAFAAYLALRRQSATDLTLAVVVALGAATKLVLFDMAALSGIARVAAFMGCGAIMVAIAFLRQHRRPAHPHGAPDTPAPQGPADRPPWDMHHNHH